jgi:competence protein ComFC
MINNKKVGAIPDFFYHTKNHLLDFLFPVECLGCGRDGKFLCDDCRRCLEITPNHGCIFCGSKNLSGKTCHSCRQKHCLDGVFAASEYGQKEMSALIKGLKYQMIRALSEELASFTISAIRQHRLLFNRDLLPDSCLYCPVPLHPKRLKWRGFNQSELIAEKISKEFGWSKVAGLTRSKNSKPQAKLDGAERLKNLSNCFTFSGNKIDGKKIILIDDVTTTGSTLEEAAKALKIAGAKNVWGLTIARG